MKVNEIMAASTVGTTLMTGFSEIMSKAKGSNYNEAIILGELLNRITPLTKTQAKAAGWLAHYSVGLAFGSFYKLYLKQANAQVNAGSGMVYGLLSGLAGVAVWKATFKMHPNPPDVDLKTYYKQLVLAHIVFGVATALTYKAVDKA